MFLCSFLFLMFSGTLTYVYLLWTTYWDRVAKISRDYHRYHQRPFKHPSQAKAVMNQQHHQKMKDIGGTTTPPFSLKDLPMDKLMHHVKHYKRQITNQLSSAVTETGKTVAAGKVDNMYHVVYPPDVRSNRIDRTREELLCQLAKINASTFLLGDPFFEGQQMGSYLPSHPLRLMQGSYKTCAVVSSAGSLLSSKLGSHIDSNEFVIRFNNAPTLGYEKDVGNKTSIRIVNSQVVGKPKFGFLSDDDKGRMYGGDGTPVLVWDPSSYNSSLEGWYKSPDFPFFETYFAKRLMQKSDVHLLNPFVLWDIWRFLQAQFDSPILPNPPSSGFLGVALAARVCETVHVYEYVPSMRLTKRCHYYDSQENLGCTIGDWHPLAAEKLVALRLNIANDTAVYSDGYVAIPGFRSASDRVQRCV